MVFTPDPEIIKEHLRWLSGFNNQHKRKWKLLLEIDPEAADLPIVTKRMDNIELNTVMSNSFGFGGTNATLIVKRYAE